MKKRLTNRPEKSGSSLLDQGLFLVDGETFDGIVQVLSSPLPNDTKLKALLSTPAPWEQSEALSSVKSTKF